MPRLDDTIDKFLRGEPLTNAEQLEVRGRLGITENTQPASWVEITGKPAPVTNLTGTNTGDENAGSILTKVATGLGDYKENFRNAILALRSDNPSVLGLLKGAENDPERIGAEFLPEVYTVSTTPPTNIYLPWYDPNDGSISYYDAAQAVWVVASGPGGDGEEIFSVVTEVVITTAAHTLVTANIDRYCSFTYDLGAKTVTVPTFDGDFAPIVGNSVTIRNAGVGDLTIVGESIDVTFNAASGGLVLAPQTTAQLLYKGGNTWDLL